ncbi:hypothetical protein ABZ951_23360 [Streptomyces sp. NPDC046215]|uniref:Uncharacterized protein n=1 Tax=Streptomyces stramineus TaxID=173861 RepID=A0ABP3L3X2_9ACTN
MKATFNGKSGAEYDRDLAWVHLLTPRVAQGSQKQQADEMGEGAEGAEGGTGGQGGRGARRDEGGDRSPFPGMYDFRGRLEEIARKYDDITRIAELGFVDKTTDTDLLAALLVIRKLRDKLLLDEGRLIWAARQRKVTWARLAGALELGSRQSAERRYLQLRTDGLGADGDSGGGTQSERVENARDQRSRHAERKWAARNAHEIRTLARQLAAVPDLQERADRSRAARLINETAVQDADLAGRDRPQPIRMQWPDRLREALEADAAHCGAGPVQGASDIDTARLKTMGEAGNAHRLFGLIGYAADPDAADLADHAELIARITGLYERAGSASPRRPGRAGPGTDR